MFFSRPSSKSSGSQQTRHRVLLFLLLPCRGFCRSRNRPEYSATLGCELNQEARIALTRNGKSAVRSSFLSASAETRKVFPVTNACGCNESFFFNSVNVTLNQRIAIRVSVSKGGKGLGDILDEWFAPVQRDVTNTPLRIIAALLVIFLTQQFCRAIRNIATKPDIKSRSHAPLQHLTRRRSATATGSERQSKRKCFDHGKTSSRSG